MGRKKGIPTCVIPIREKLSIKKFVESYAKQTNKTIQQSYKELLRARKI